jgi:glyceraldehyde-3-phosphate dehydrogenase (NADP+)
VFAYLSDTPYGQQAAVFTSSTAAPLPEIVDVLSTVVGRININAQCSRSPDTLPFSGRRSSALGTMSVTEALDVFSTETVLATKSNPENEAVVKELEGLSKFMAPIVDSQQTVAADGGDGGEDL